MSRPSRDDSLFKQLLTLSPVRRSALLRKAARVGKDAKKLKIRRKVVLKEIRVLEMELAKLDKKLGLAPGTGAGRGGLGRKRGPRDPKAIRQARITRYTNTIPKLKAQLVRAKGVRKGRLKARLEKAQRLLKELS